MPFGVFLPPTLPSGLSHPPGLGETQTWNTGSHTYTSWVWIELNWIGLDLQAAEVEFELKWQEEETKQIFLSFYKESK